MEVAGLLIGTVALVGTFKDCIDLFSYISASRSFGRDAELLDTKLDVEKVLLLQWADRVRLLSCDFDNRLNDPRTTQTISRVLASIRLLLSESSSLQQRYGLTPVTENIVTEVTPIISGPRMACFIKEFCALNVQVGSGSKHIPAKEKIRWVIRDKAKFEVLIGELSSFIIKLNDLTPAERTITISMTTEDLENITSLQKLQLVLEASANSKKGLSKLAGRTKENQQKILDALWHHTITERVDSLKDAHGKTFRWVLNPPRQDDEWDDLSAWLRFGSGIYWLSGKAGSGKSTLMKYLLHHDLAHKLLEKWAGDDSLSVCSFFFWALGTSQQQSQQGLMRMLLYQVLDADSSLILKLLPNSWRQLQSNEPDKWNGLSSIELKEAFQKLATVQLAKRKFFFIIDGLDEYAGSSADGVDFIQGLVRNSNIKVLLSSRPIPDCVQAFSSNPKLRLQDLTREDIAAYVDDVIGSHQYMQNFATSETIQFEELRSDICRKASGVFLWVILACRSLCDGFAAYDSISELQSRVDELPPELEDLFQHMLDNIEPRYKSHATKLLRICQQSKLKDLPIPTLGLAIIEQNDVSLGAIPSLRQISNKEREEKCRVLEGRLRSRCCGLLELAYFRKPYEFWETSAICSCTCPNGGHVSVVDSTVEFIHRSVLEFLTLPDVWHLSCLVIKDEFFEASAVLSCMWFYMAEAKMMRLGSRQHNFEDSTDIIKEAFRLLSATDSKFLNCITRVFLRYQEQLAMWVLTETKKHSSSIVTDAIRRRWPGSSKGQMLEIIVPLAVEAGMEKFVRSFAIMDLSEAAPRFQAFPLLYHALKKPYLCYIARWEPVTSNEMISYLISSGCDPNEEFLDISGAWKTPWTCFLEIIPKVKTLEAFSMFSDITEIFLNGGANPKASSAPNQPSLYSTVKSLLVSLKGDTKSSTAEFEPTKKRGLELLELIEQKLYPSESKASHQKTRKVFSSSTASSSSRLPIKRRNLRKLGKPPSRLRSSPEQEGPKHRRKRRKTSASKST